MCDASRCSPLTSHGSMDNFLCFQVPFLECGKGYLASETFSSPHGPFCSFWEATDTHCIPILDGMLCATDTAGNKYIAGVERGKPIEKYRGSGIESTGLEATEYMKRNVRKVSVPCRRCHEPAWRTSSCQSHVRPQKCQSFIRVCCRGLSSLSLAATNVSIIFIVCVFAGRQIA